MIDGDHEPPRTPLGRIDSVLPIELEAKALIQHRSGPDEPVLGTIERDIESVLDQSDELRALHRDLDRDLLRSECRIGTDLLQLRRSQYGPDERASLRAGLKRRLEQLNKERRSVSLELHARRRLLMERLSTLVERHRQTRGGESVANRGGAVTDDGR